VGCDQIHVMENLLTALKKDVQAFPHASASEPAT
jgi:hypothetical protein